MPDLGESTTTLPLAVTLSALPLTVVIRTVLARSFMSAWVTITLPDQVPNLLLRSAWKLSEEMLIGALLSPSAGLAAGAACRLAGAASKAVRRIKACLISLLPARSSARDHSK